MGGKIAARIGVSQSTIWCWLAGKRHPTAKSLVQLRSFLDAEAKRPAGNGIRPIERVPMKIVMPRRELLYARLCPFCRKARGEIQSIGRRQFHGVCPKCGGYRAKAGESAGSAQGVERERIDGGRKRAASDYTERFSGGIKVNLDVPNPIEICGRA